MKTMMKVNVCCHLGESGCLPLRFFKLVSLFRLAGIPSCDNSASNVRGLQKPALQSSELFQTIRLGLDRISGTMFLVKVCQSCGSDYRSLPRRFKQKLFKVILSLSKQWGAINRRAPEKIYFFKRDLS